MLKSKGNPSQSEGEWPRRNGAFIDAGDSAILTEDLAMDGAGRALFELALAGTIDRTLRMVCIDSGANIFILRFLLFLYKNLRAVGDHFIRTAAQGGRLQVEALYDVGHVVDVRHSPEAAANLMPTNVIMLCGCSVLLDMETRSYAALLLPRRARTEEERIDSFKFNACGTTTSGGSTSSRL